MEHETKSIQVLHVLMRSFDHFMGALLRCYAGVFTWKKSKGSYTDEILQSFKERLQEIIVDSTGIQWDRPDPTGKGGTSTTGNIARRHGGNFYLSLYVSYRLRVLSM